MVLEEHPMYDWVGELGVDQAIDGMNLLFLFKWDSSAADGFYGVTVEVEDEGTLEDYVISTVEEQLMYNEGKDGNE